MPQGRSQPIRVFLESCCVGIWWHLAQLWESQDRDHTAWGRDRAEAGEEGDKPSTCQKVRGAGDIVVASAGWKQRPGLLSGVPMYT